MTRRRAAVLALLAVAACDDAGAPIAEEDLALTVTADAQDAEFGRGFPVTVVRVWRKELVPAAWDDALLAPLTLRLVGESRRDDGRRIEETRRYLGYAFREGDVKTAAPRFDATPRAGGRPRVASAPPLTIRVRTAVDPKSPGPAELPGEPLGVPAPRGLVVAGAMAAVAAIALLVRTVRSRTRPAVVVATPEREPDGPHVVALARLRELRRTDARDATAFHVEASDIVREYVRDRFGPPATRWTTEELAADPRVSGASRDALMRVLEACDLVKFALGDASAAERSRLLDSAEAFVAQSAPAGTIAA